MAAVPARADSLRHGARIEAKDTFSRPRASPQWQRGLSRTRKKRRLVLTAPTKNANLHGAALSTSPILRKGLSFGKKQALLQSAEELRPMSRSTFVYRNLDECLHKRMSLTRRPKVERVIDLALVHTAQTAVALNGVIVLDESEGHRSDTVGFVTGRNVPG